MATRDMDGRGVHEPRDFYEAFVVATTGLLPDPGTPGFAALRAALRELTEPLTLILRNSAAARSELGDWLDLYLAVLQERPSRHMPVDVILD